MVKLTNDEGPAGIIYAAAACYLLGGLLIRLRRRWLWIIGAVMNGLVFFRMYLNRPDVLFSPGGLISKTLQLLLEVDLLYLTITYPGRSTSLARE